MRTIKTKVYQFSELKEEAKNKALEHYRDINTMQDDWDFPITEDWESKLLALGYFGGKVLYSGFGSQGDGACFTCEYVDLERYFKAHKIKKFKDLLAHDEEGTIKITHNARYCYATSTTVEDTFYCEEADELTKLIEAEREELGNKIYKELESYYFELQEDEAVIDTIEANEYEFLEDGSSSLTV